MREKRNYLYIVATCLFSYLIYLIIEFYFTHGKMGVPLDDTWIHFQFADNFTKGFFFQYNPGEPTAGTTSPLYVIILGTFSLLVNNFILSSILLSATFQILSCIFIYKLSLLIFRSEYSPLKKLNSDKITPEFTSLIVALLTALAGRLVWSSLSGMETTMFTFFCLAGIYFHIKNLINSRFNLLPVLCLSLAAVSRPEGYLLCLIYFFDVSANLFKDKQLKGNYLKLFLAVFILLLITLPYPTFSYLISGNFFPNTYRGQGGGFNLIPDFNYLRIAGIYFFRDNFLTGLLYLASIVFYAHRLRKYFKELRLINLIFLWTILFPVAFSVFIPNWRHHVRYLIPLIPFINFISVYIFLNIVTDYKKLLGVKNLILKKPVRLSYILIISLIYFVVYAIALGKNTDNINSQQVKLANWVRDNVGSDETIALNDIGAITFINKNKIIDMMGLVTPEILKYRTYQLNDNLDSTNSLLKKNNVSYIIIYDEWFKEFLEKYGSTLTLVTSAILEDNTICGGKEMKVYKTNFNIRKN